MSVIYKSLKKLHSGAGESEVSGAAFRRKRPNRSERSVLKSPLFIGVSVVLMITMGFGLVYAVYHFRSVPDEPVSMELLSASSRDNIGHFMDQHENSELSEEINSAEAEFSPPGLEVENTDDEPGLQVAAQKKVGSSTAPVNISKTEVIQGSQVPGFSAPVDNAESEKTVARREQGFSYNSRESSGGNRYRKMNQENRTRSYRIINLVKQIQSTLKTGNQRDTERLLTKLEKLKGKNDSYLLKLRSYLYMRNGENEAAYRILKKVILGNEKDLEAGINMAIIEIRTERSREAAERLKNLAKVYPENSMIKKLIKQMGDAR